MNEWLRIILSVLFFGALVTLFVGLYVLNARTKKPEGCIDQASTCESCGVASSCSVALHREDK